MLNGLDFPDVQIEELPTGLFELTQDGFGGNESTCVIIHRLHVRALAEQLGMLTTTDPRAEQVTAALARRLRALKLRIGTLAHYLCCLSDREHADLDHECDLASALADLADEYVADLDALTGRAASSADSSADSMPCPSNVAGLSPGTSAGQPMDNGCAAAAKTPENGAARHHQERGAFRGADPAAQPSEAIPKSAPLGKNGTASPKSDAERAKAYRERHAVTKSVTSHVTECDVTRDVRDGKASGNPSGKPSIDQLELSE